MPGAELKIRPATLDDADEVAEFLTRCAVTYLGRPSSRQEALQRLTASGPDPEASAIVVATPDGRIIGFGNVWMAGPGDIKCFARVDPEMTRRGVGTSLLGRLEARAQELIAKAEVVDRRVITATQWAEDTAGAGLFVGRGYSEVRFFLRMIADDLNDLDRHDTPLPAGIAIRSVQPGWDDDDLFDAWREAFAEEWGQSHVDAQEWWRERRVLAAFDPSLWFVAVAERIVGFVTAREELEGDGRLGYISDIGVRPEWRGKGLGYALLIRSLSEMHRRGLGSAALNVDSDNRTSALRLYRKAGMRELPHFTIWGKQLG